MKKKKIITIVGCACIMSQFNVWMIEGLAYNNTPSSKVETYETTKDIDIKWLDYNTTFFIGADMEIEAYIKDDPLNQNIIWSLNQDGIINMATNEHKATLVALKAGMVEVAAIVNDGSDSRIHRNMIVSHYPTDKQSQRYLEDGIQPILKVGIIDPITQVEVEKELTSEKKVATMDTYLMKLASLGTLQLETYVTGHELYDFANISMEEDSAFKLDIRIHKQDASYETLKNMINQLPLYNQGGGLENQPPLDKENEEQVQPPLSQEEEQNEEQVQPPLSQEEEQNKPSINPLPTIDDTEVPPKETPEDEKETIVPSVEEKSDPFQWKDKHILVNKDNTGTKDDPYTISIDSNLSSLEKIRIMRAFWQQLNQNYPLSFIQLRETKDFAIVKYKLSSILGSQFIKNDFYIELYIEKEDKVYYENMIDMLNLNENKQGDLETSTVINKAQEEIIPLLSFQQLTQKEGSPIIVKEVKIPYESQLDFPNVFNRQQQIQNTFEVNNPNKKLHHYILYFIGILTFIAFSKKRTK